MVVVDSRCGWPEPGGGCGLGAEEEEVMVLAASDFTGGPTEHTTRGGGRGFLILGSKTGITGGVPQTELNGVRVRRWSDLMH